MLFKTPQAAAEYLYIEATKKRFFRKRFDHYIIDRFFSNEERDYQRQKVYDSEEETQFRLGYGRKYNRQSAQNALNRIVNSKWWKRRFPFLKKLILKSNPRLKGCAAYMFSFEIKFSKFISRIELLHEIAHFLPPTNHSGHGILFCKFYLKLVDRFMGKQYAKELQKQFDHHKVKYEKL